VIPCTDVMPRLRLKSESFVFLDVDDVLLPSTIDMLIAGLQVSSSFALAFCDCRAVPRRRASG
jgi:hypothetical protein